ncbi:hypothetical protein V5735_17915 (plasmid) [Haladaptatus sp. SPP-AMP-3]|uniref:DUF7351 domain-containing protein n=1 Tax=Haladaptatus sp. SPP-AMP-3 TaxID=3121295 RepID=UPI003C2DFD37
MSDGESNSTEALDSVSNSTRVEILRVLADAHGDSPTGPWLAYSELREAVGIRDNGNFNYHLDQLGGLVVKGSSGYRLSRIGMSVVSAISSGVFDTEWTWGPIDAPGHCRRCDDSLQLRYEGGILWLSCGIDEHSVPLSIPPSLLESHPEGSEAEIVERIAFLENQWGSLTRRGICSECQGYVEGRIETIPEDPDHYHYHGRCRRCGFHHGIPVGMFLASHPAVTSFYYERGVDVLTTPFWTLEFCAPGRETVLSTDPLRLGVDANLDGETLSLTLNRDGTVVSTAMAGASAEEPYNG